MPTLISVFTDIANSLRSKLGVSDTFKPTQMANAVNNLDMTKQLNGITYFNRNDLSSYQYAVGLSVNSSKNFSYNGIGGYFDNTYMSGNGSTQQESGYLDPVTYWNTSDCTALFDGNSSNFSQYSMIYIGNRVTSCDRMFNGCYRFNQPVTIGNNVTDCYMMFNSCTSFNQPVTIGSNVELCYMMFSNCTSFNKPITIPNNVTSCFGMFNNCTRFNQPIIIPKNVINCDYMFNCCDYFNQPVTIGSNVTNCYSMFSYCYYFNQPIIIHNNITNCASMVYTCTRFNQPVTIGSNVTNCASMFYSCFNFNQSVTIPKNVTNCSSMFYYCNNLSRNIYINSTSGVNVRRMLSGKNNSKPINVFCNNIAVLNSTNSLTSLVGLDITWTSTTNGYYNSTYNIYIYNNYSGT